jgi:hypothetical protein
MMISFQKNFEWQRIDEVLSVSGGTGIVSKRMAPPFDELPFSASSWRLAIRCRAQQR